jgi:hypothetical protein
MADEPEEITVKVEDAEPKVESTPEADPVAELKAQYDELQTQQKQEQESRQAAETRARTAEAAQHQAEEVARTARTEVTDTRLSSIDQAIDAAKSEADSANSEYTAALEAGDWKKAGEAQRKLARAEARGVQYEQNKATWETYKAQPEPRQRPAGDPVDNYINQVAAQTPNSANWLRNHRDWVTDPKKNAKLTSAHWDAVGEGIAVDTPQYFAHVERVIGLEKPESKTNGADKSPPPRRQAAAPVASVTSSPGGTSGGGAEVRLSKNEAAAATDGTLQWNYDDPSGQKRFKKGDPIGLQEMARRKKTMTEQGLYDKTRYEA